MSELDMTILNDTREQTNRPRRLKYPLLKKIHLLVTLSVCLAVGLISVLTIMTQTKIMREHLFAQNHLVLGQIATAVNSAFYSLNWGFVEEVLRNAVREEGILQLDIIRPDGEIYLSSAESQQSDVTCTGSDTQWIDKQSFYMSKELKIGTDTWCVLLQGTTGSIKKQELQSIYHNLILGLLVICLTSFAAFFFSQRLTRSIVQLSKATARIGKGAFGAAVTVKSNDEIGMLAQDINGMSQQLKKLYNTQQQHNVQLELEIQSRTKDLQETYERMETILKTTSQGFLCVNNELISSEVNPKMAEILGRSEKDIVGRSLFDFVDAENGKIISTQARIRETFQSSEYELEFTRPDGNRIPCLLNVTPLFNHAGIKTGAFAMIADISALKENESRLRQLKILAEQANQEKSSFLANMSHEIRTPLNGIIGTLELLGHKDVSASKQWKLVSTAQKSADFLLVLLNDILDLAKIEAGHFVLDNIPFSLDVLCDRLRSMFANQAEQKGIRLALKVSDTVPEVVTGDETRLQQICINLLSNALKFTSSGQVSLTLTCEPNEENSVLLTGQIADTGIGIPKDKQETIFNTFAQADMSTTREYGGTGLGLALCRNLCTLMGGNIHFESVEDLGATFTFQIPLGVGEKDQTIETKNNKQPDKPLPERTQKLAILVVDDNEVNRDVTAMFLETEGHLIKTANNGLEALEVLSKKEFDCVLMDIQMPHMDGITATVLIRICEQETMKLQSEYNNLLKPLHAKLRGSHTPIIALTANVLQRDRQKYHEARMDGFLGKPMRQQEILRILSKVTNIPLTCSKETENMQRVETELVETVSVSEIKKYLHATYSLSSEQIDTLLLTSVRGVREGIDALGQAWEAGDKTELARSAHKLKGTLATIGLEQLTQKAQKIQLAARENEDRDYGLWISEMNCELSPLLEG